MQKSTPLKSSSTAQQSITLNAVNNNTNWSDSDVYIGFWGTSLNAQLSTDAPMQLGTWYALTDIQGLQINATTSGRFFVAYSPSGAPAFSPDESILPTWSASSNGYTDVCDIFDKFEITFDGSPSGCADLTAIDFWCIPMSLSTSLQGNPVAELDGLKGTTTAQDLFNALAPVSQPPQSVPTIQELIAAFKSSGNPLPAGIAAQLKTLSKAVAIDTSTTPNSFVRIVGPQSYPTVGSPAADPAAFPGLPFTPYDTFLEYYTYLIDTFGPGTPCPVPGFQTLGNGTIATISGEFAGSQAGTGPQYEPQSYRLTASIDSSGTVTIDGSGTIYGAIKIVIGRWDLLNPSGSYGATPLFSLNGGQPQATGNDLFGWILGDFFAGLNIGAIGSSVSVENASEEEVAVGDLISSDWFALLPDQNLLFSALWPAGTANRWNQWAAALLPLSDAYGFAFAERFSAPLINLDPDNVDTLTLTLLDRTVAVAPQPVSTADIVCVIDANTIMQAVAAGKLAAGTATVPTSLGSWTESDQYIFMIADGSYVSNNQGKSELSLDCSVGDQVRWSITNPSADFTYNCLLYNFVPNKTGIISPPQPVTKTVTNYCNTPGNPAVPVASNMTTTVWTANVESIGSVQYSWAFMIVDNATGETVGYFFWDPFIKVTA